MANMRLRWGCLPDGKGQDAALRSHVIARSFCPCRETAAGPLSLASVLRLTGEGLPGKAACDGAVPSSGRPGWQCGVDSWP